MNGTTPLIRRGMKADAAALVDFNVAMARETEDKQLDPQVVAAGVEGLFQRPDAGFYLVAEVAGEVVGGLMVTFEWSDWRAGRFWWIQSVYVLPEHRRRGIFRALYRRVEQEARQSADVCGVRLYVEHHNRTAQATYHELGMRETTYRMYEREFGDGER